MTKVHKHDPTKFPNIYFSKKKAPHNFCSFRFKVFIHKVFHKVFIHKVYPRGPVLPHEQKVPL